MATTIKIKNSVTATTTPTSLVQGEVAINVTDKKVWVGNAATTPIQIVGAGTTGNAAGSNNQVQYNSSGSFAGDADFTFNGTTVTMANDASISGLTVGKGGGAVSTNTALGTNALNTNSAGVSDTAVGYRALYLNTGNNNTAVGSYAAFNNAGGASVVAVGKEALYGNTSGNYNTAVGDNALSSNTTASNNTAVGYQAGYSNTTGTIITAIGRQALYANTTGTDNTALGYAMVSNTTGSQNTGIGAVALQLNTTGTNNTAMGYQALDANTTGDSNTAVGVNALGAQTTASSNTAIGVGSGGTITTGTKNSILGRYDGNQGGLDIRTASNYIVLSDGDGNPRQVTNNNGFLKASDNGVWGGVTSVSHEICTSKNDSYGLRVFVTASSGGGFPMQLAWTTQTNNNTTDRYLTCSDATSTKMQVFSNGNIQNQNGSYGTISDIKNKENIVDATPKLDKVNQLKVRNFNLKDDETKLKQIGFIAQEFEEVFPSMIEESPDMDIDGNKTGETTKAIKTTVLIPILVKAIQELKAEVDSLKQQLNGA